MRYAKLSVALVGALAVAGISLADDIDKKTTLTVNETIMVPGKILSPGKYVMKLANVTANRHVVQIFNEDQTELQTTIMAIPNYQVEVKSDTVLTFWETPAGSPRALRAWFYPGDNFGQEFAYPKEEAERIARANNDAKIPEYEAKDESPRPSVVQPTEAAIDRSVSPREETPVARSEAPVLARPQTTTIAQQPSNDVIAQNAPAPRPTLPNSDEIGINERAVDSELPQTGSNMPGILLAGLCAIAGAFVLRRLQA